MSSTAAGAVPLAAVRPGIRELVAYPIEHERVQVKLDANEASFELPPAIGAALGEVTRTVDLRRYPSGHSEALVAAMADALGIPATCGLAGNGSNEMIALVLTAFAGRRADGSAPVLVIATPSFGVYPIQATCHGYEIETVPLRADYTLDGERVVERARARNAALVLLGSPNNPTGNSFASAEIERVLDAFDGPVVVDEAYQPFAGTTWLGRWDRWPQLVVLRTLSKVGLAALRVGFLFGHEALVAELLKAKLPFNLNALSAHVAEVAVRHWPELLERARAVAAERERLSARLTSLADVHVFPSDANFLLVRVREAERVWADLLARGISVRNFSRKAALDGCLRVTVGTPSENDAFAAGLAEVLSR